MSYLTRQAANWIKSGAVFAKMIHSTDPRLNLYWIKRAGKHGFTIHIKTGEALERQGYVPEIWRYTGV